MARKTKTPGTTARTLTQPEQWWQAFYEQATREGKSISAWIGDTCKRRLDKDLKSKLQPRPTRGQPRKSA